MNCGGLFFGTVLLVVSLVYICTGRIPSKSGRTALRRYENPRAFWFYNFIMSAIGILCIIWGFTTPRPRGKAINSNQSIRLPATSSPSAPLMTETVLDQQIAARLNKQSMLLMEGRDWETSVGFRRQDQPVGRLIDQMYNSGAPKVYVDAFGAGRGDRTARLLTIDVELPSAADQRQACFKAVAEFQKTNPECFVSPNLPTTARYLEMRIPR